jgi:hypothetical protein
MATQPRQLHVRLHRAASQAAMVAGAAGAEVPKRAPDLEVEHQHLG